MCGARGLGRARRFRIAAADGHSPPAARARLAGCRPAQLPRLGVHADLQGDVHHPGRRLRLLRSARLPGRDRHRHHRPDAHRSDGGPPPGSKAARLPAAHAAAAARDQGDPAALQGRPDEGARRPAGALQGTRHQPAVGLLSAAAPDAAPVHHVLGHPERPDQPEPDGDARGVRRPGRAADVHERRQRGASTLTSRASTR